MKRHTKIYGSAVLAALILGLLILGLGSYELSYLTVAAAEHLRLMAARQPIQLLIESPDTRPDVRRKLELALRARRFASQTLGLPDNESYTSYVDLGRPEVAWNVLAAPRFSITPVEWCFPIAGCVVYRGHFSEEAAREFARRQQQEGNDVYVAPVAAYSTLGWFDDPVLSTLLDQSAENLAAIIFHELAHQQLYVPDDSPFNEGFAVAVEREGVRRWLRSERQDGVIENVSARWRETDAQVRLILETRDALARLFSSELTAVEKQQRKRALLQQLQDTLCGGGGSCEDKALPRAASGQIREMNNAYLAAVATYHAHIPAFEDLLARANGSLPRFYELARDMAKLSRQERRNHLEE